MTLFRFLKKSPIPEIPEIARSAIDWQKTPDNDRLAGALLGTLVGDALGVPYEFHRPEALPPKTEIEMVPPSGFSRSHASVPPGTWSDDGAQTLALLDSLKTHRDLRLDDFGVRLLSWWNDGRYAPDRRVFDIGNQTKAALLRLEAGVSASLAGGIEDHDNGNGSLMRNVACALVPVATTAAMIDRARRQGLVTHGHPISQWCCALSALVTAQLLRGATPDVAMGIAIQEVNRSLATMTDRQAMARILDGARRPPTGRGYVVDCFWSAWHALTTTATFDDCVKTAIALGNDTDTTACVAGGWAGALHGRQGIPARWIDALQPCEDFDPSGLFLSDNGGLGASSSH